MANAHDFSNLSPPELYELVSSMDAEEFEELMNEEASRDQAIEAMIEAMVGLFRPDQAEGVEAVIHIKLWDAPGGGYDHYEMLIDGGKCILSKGPEREPDLTLKVRPTDLRKLVNGDTGPKRLAFKGRLRAIGDLGLGMKLPELFDFS